MNHIKYSILLLLPFWSIASFSQDMIYTNNDKISCNIIEISDNMVKYILPNKTATVSIPLNKTVMLFNERGDYIVSAKLNMAKESVVSFVNSTSNARPNDVIYTIGKSKFTGLIEEEDKNNVFIYSPEAAEKISTKEIAAIIYKNGRHKIMTSFDKAALILYTMRDPEMLKMEPGASATKTTPNSERTTKPAGTTLVQTPDKSGTAVNTIKSDTKKNKNPPPAPPPPLLTKEEIIQEKYKELAPESNFEAFKEKIQKKVYELNDYLKIICNKKDEITAVEKASRQALDLFVNDKSKVEVSNLSRNLINIYIIPEYLRHLRNNDYDKITIEWTNIQYVTNFRRGTDGQYSASITFEQVFRGYKDGKVVYEDLTVKKAEIKLKNTQKIIEGSVVEGWDVLLSDIGVQSTSLNVNN
jgi:hypothetical protein